MPKMKSHSGAKKRFQVSTGGKVKHKTAGLRHLLTGMSARRGRRLRHSGYLTPVEGALMRRLLPYH
ncbi:MAG: 50S ribosomal protein L35 [Elusimicrobia bacterium]|nr:50S ribosomal protein L35 [Elusimicrobiota bacterium]